MLKGFKAFLLRGNVFELAVAVVMGTAFTAVVTSVVTNLIQPLIAAIGGNNINGLAVQINANNPQTTMRFDAVITSLINFVVIGLVVYFAFVLPVTKLMSMRKRGQATEEVPPTDTELLTEIRDLLREQRGTGAGR